MTQRIGDVIELSVVVRDLDAAVDHYEKLFGLTVHHRGESVEFGFINAILPLGVGHIELLQPTDPEKAVGQFLQRRGEGVYLVGFNTDDIAGAAAHVKEEGARIDIREDVAWVHPSAAHGLMVEMRKPENFG